MALQPTNDTATDPDLDELVNAPEDIVRTVLVALCQDPSQEHKAIAHFKKLKKFRSEQLSRNDGGAAGSTGSSADVATGNETSTGDNRTSGGELNKKRAASEIRICDECQEAFEEDDNRSDACRYHIGSREINDASSTWDDYEDWRFGDREEKAEEYPEGFNWDCCNERGDGPGCTRGPHTARYKRAQIGRAVIPID